MKPIITREAPGRWTVTRPGYGFNPKPQSVTFPTWKAAVASLSGSIGSAGPIIERQGGIAAAGRGWWPVRPRWIDMEAS